MTDADHTDAPVDAQAGTSEERPDGDEPLDRQGPGGLPAEAAVPLPVPEGAADETAPPWQEVLDQDAGPAEREAAPSAPLVEPLETWAPRVGGVPLDADEPASEPTSDPAGPAGSVVATPEEPATRDGPGELGGFGLGGVIGGPVINPVLVGAHRSNRQWQRSLEVGQGSRGTCWAFAGIAALEAAYARRGVTVDLSEQYLFHIMKAHEAHRNGTAFTSLIGFMGAADIVRNMTYTAVPESRNAPYLDQPVLTQLAAAIPKTGGVLGPVVAGTLEQSDWFEYDLRLIPLMARWYSQYRVKSFSRLTNYSIADVKKAIDDGLDVVVDVFDKINNGGHCIVIFGYDDRTRTFEIKNSQSTANGGFATMAYSNDAQFTLQNGSAYCITDVWPVQTQWQAMWVGRWEIDHDGWRGRLVIRRFCDLRSDQTEVGPGNPISMGTWYGENGRVLDVVGHFVDGGRGLHCTIGGQPFELYLHTRDPYRASGRCQWNGTWFGVVASRGTATGAGDGFDRTETIGLWDTTHDGWRGQLRIGVDPSYVEAATSITRAASIDPSAISHEVVTHVDFGGGNNQRFQLLAHTREDGLLGGVTQWGGQDWPVEGRMSRNLYAVRGDGTLWWYRHPGRFRLTQEWDAPRQVGTGWAGLPAIFGGGDGVVYVIRTDGTLAWYFHDGRNQGTFDWRGPAVVGSGWGQFRAVFAGDGGVIYAITQDGRLLWYRHLGRRDGSARWEGPQQVGVGWEQFPLVSAAPDGTVYAVRPDGTLWWYRHYGHDQGYPIWHGPLTVGSGWNQFDAIWPVGQGLVYARVPKTLGSVVVTPVHPGAGGLITSVSHPVGDAAGDPVGDPAGDPVGHLPGDVERELDPEAMVSAAEGMSAAEPGEPRIRDLTDGATDRDRGAGKPGDLLLYHHSGFLIGDQSWRYAGVVGTGWGWPIRAVFAT